MKTVKTSANQSYVATLTTGGTIKDTATDFLLTAVPGAGQVGFVALGPETTLSDDRALVVPITANNTAFGSFIGASSDTETYAGMAFTEAANSFSGNNTHAGVETFNGPVALNGTTVKLEEYVDSAIPTRKQMRCAAQAAIYAWDGFVDSSYEPGKVASTATVSQAGAPYNRLVTIAAYDGSNGEKETVDAGSFSMCSDLGLYSIHTYGGRFLAWLGMRMEDQPYIKPGQHTWSVIAGADRGWHWKHVAVAFFNNYNLSQADIDAGRSRRLVYVMDARDESLLYASILPYSNISSHCKIRVLVGGGKYPNQNYLTYFINNSAFAPIQGYHVQNFPEEQGGGYYIKSKRNDTLKICTLNNLQPYGSFLPVMKELVSYRQPAAQVDVVLGVEGQEYAASPEGETVQWTLSYKANTLVDGAALDEWITTPAPTLNMRNLTLNIEANDTGEPRWTWLIYGAVGQPGKVLKVTQAAR